MRRNLLINTFEGGAILTNNDALAEKFHLMRNFGFSCIDKVISIGTNGKMNEISAAMGLASLKSLDEFIATNYRNYKLYQLELSGFPGLTLISYNENEKNNYQYIIVEIDETIADITRDQIVEILWNEKVLARRYFYPGCHGMEPYRTIYPNTGLRLPETEKMVRRLIALPTSTVVLPGTRIGEGVVVAANSVVTRDVKPYKIVDDSPSKFIREVTVPWN